MTSIEPGAARAEPSSPGDEDRWIELVEARFGRGDLAGAAEIVARALSERPSSERLQALQALSKLRLGDLSGAYYAVERLWASHATNVQALTVLGNVAAAVEWHDIARQAFERAVQGRPDDPQLLFNLATSLRNFGEFARAEHLYDRVIQSRPHDWEAYQNRSELRPQTVERNHIRELEAAITRVGADWRGGVMLNYALGKEREDLRDYDGAFAAFDAGANLRRRHMTYSVDQDIDRMAKIGRVFDANWLASQAAGCESPEPIFIFGLPRAGSTLLERMLGAHPDVLAAGELQNFGLATVRLAGRPDAARSEDLVDLSARIDPVQLGEAYLASTRPRTGATGRFIDKLPGNTLYAGLIAAALPNATLIHIHRDPRDAAFGMYKTLFKQAYPFSYDLGELTRYMHGHQHLVAHWRAVMPGRIVDVAYEDLVEYPESVLGGVLDRCGLAFDPACLTFFESSAASSTASSVQVRKPIYRSAIGTWRRYERHLGPMASALAASPQPTAASPT
jgi:tetratricopeptide (TPR) repeat protein